LTRIAEAFDVRLGIVLVGATDERAGGDGEAGRDDGAEEEVAQQR